MKWVWRIYHGEAIPNERRNGPVTGFLKKSQKLERKKNKRDKIDKRERKNSNCEEIHHTMSLERGPAQWWHRTFWSLLLSLEASMALFCIEHNLTRTEENPLLMYHSRNAQVTLCLSFFFLTLVHDGGLSYEKYK